MLAIKHQELEKKNFKKNERLGSIRLSDIPVKMTVETIVSTPVGYNLVGLIAQTPGHYVAYKRRLNNKWDYCNDMAQDGKIKFDVSPLSKINPMLLIYVTTS